MHSSYISALQNSLPHIRIAVFASGAGSNAQKIIEYFSAHPFIKVALIVCNKKGAGVLNIAAQNNIPVLMIERDTFYHGNAYVDELLTAKIDLLVLAGFLWKIPSKLLAAFQNKIINIHPALLPKYGGKGMYGNFVHQAVLASAEKETGITIHLVDEIYDHGQIIFQSSCEISPQDSVAEVAAKVHALEHKFYPQIIEQFITNNFSTKSSSK